MLEDFKYIANSNLSFDKLKNKTVLIVGENDAVNESTAFSLLLRNDLFGDNIKVISVGKLNQQDRDDFIAINDFFENFDKIAESAIDYIIFISTDEYDIAKSKTRIGTLLAKSKTMISSVMALAARKKARLVFVSPMNIYGSVHNGFEPIKEDEVGYISLTDSKNLSGADARFSETLVSNFAKERGLSVSFARLPIMYGYGRGLCSKIARKFSILFRILRLIQQFCQSLLMKNERSLSRRLRKSNTFYLVKWQR